MTSGERINAAHSHTEPDRTPIFEYVLLGPVAEYFLGRPYVDYAGETADGLAWLEACRRDGLKATVRQYAMDRLDLAESLGHDMLYVVPNPVPPPDLTPSGSSAPTEPVTDDPVERVRARTEAARLFGGVPSESLLVYHHLRDEMDQRGLDLPVLAAAYLHGVWTDIDLMQTMVLEPEVAHAHFEQATKIALAYIDAYAELGVVDQIGVGGDFAGNRPLISPESYREFIVPEVRKLSRRIHELGMRAVNASDGFLWPVIDDFLLGCEVDGYLEIDLHAGMDLSRLKRGYGGSVTLYGNMDCGNTMSFGTPDEIRRSTVECIEAGSGNGGHIFCCSNAITASVPVANYLAMVNAYRDVFGLEKLT
jgi:hypothetical protein